MSYNVFLDLGFPEEEAAEWQDKARLIYAIYNEIMRLHCSVRAVAVLLQVEVQDAETLCRARHSTFHVEQLQSFLDILQGKESL